MPTARARRPRRSVRCRRLAPARPGNCGHCAERGLRPRSPSASLRACCSLKDSIPVLETARVSDPVRWKGTGSLGTRPLACLVLSLVTQHRAEQLLVPQQVLVTDVTAVDVFFRRTPHPVGFARVGQEVPDGRTECLEVMRVWKQYSRARGDLVNDAADSRSDDGP